MAIFHLDVKTISRGRGQSSLASAAYRSGSRLFDRRIGLAFDYEHRRRSEQIVDVGLVGWSGSREDLWNAAEAAERRSDAMVAREVLLALPHELDAEQRRGLAHGYAEYLHQRFGVAVDYAIHRPSADGDGRNDHVHLMITTRSVELGALGPKTRELDVKKTSSAALHELRQKWEAMANDALAAADIGARVDRRPVSVVEDVPDYEPMPHLGPAVIAMERRGTKTIVGNKRRQQQRRNDVRLEVRRRRRVSQMRQANGMANPAATPDQRAEAFRDRAKMGLLKTKYGKGLRLASGVVQRVDLSGDAPMIYLKDGARIADLGQQLVTTDPHSLAAIETMIVLAKAKGWHAIEFTGSADWKRRAAVEATRRGLPVTNPDLESVVAQTRQKMALERLMPPVNPTPPTSSKRASAASAIRPSDTAQAATMSLREFSDYAERQRSSWQRQVDLSYREQWPDQKRLPLQTERDLWMEAARHADLLDRDGSKLTVKLDSTGKPLVEIALQTLELAMGEHGFAGYDVREKIPPAGVDLTPPLI